MAGSADLGKLHQTEDAVREVVSSHPLLPEMEDDFKTIRILLAVLNKQQMSIEEVQWAFAHLAEHLAEMTAEIAEDDEVESVDAFSELDDYMVELENTILSRTRITDDSLNAFFLQYFAEKAKEEGEPEDGNEDKGAAEQTDDA